MLQAIDASEALLDGVIIEALGRTPDLVAAYAAQQRAADLVEQVAHPFYFTDALPPSSLLGDKIHHHHRQIVTRLAAIVDGASQFTIFWRIVGPTWVPILATIALLYGTGHWNDFFWPSILIQSQLHPASVVLHNMVGNRCRSRAVLGDGCIRAWSPRT